MLFHRSSALSLAAAALSVAVAAGSAFAAPAAAAKIKLASHRAVYNLSLARPDPAGSVVGLHGRLAIEFTDVCEGYTLNQRIRTEMINNEGGGLVTDFSISSWESRDGKRFRFSMRNEVNGQLVEEFVGHADLGSGGAPGTAQLTKPDAKTVPLPPDTVFPTEHLQKLIAVAQAGENYLDVPVFDGSGEDGLYETGTHLGKPVPPSTETDGPLAPLAGKPSWPARIAYFPLIQRAETPEYEIGFRMFDNGISTGLLLDYGDFAMQGELELLELLPESGC